MLRRELKAGRYGRDTHDFCDRRGAIVVLDYCNNMCARREPRCRDNIVKVTDRWM